MVSHLLVGSHSEPVFYNIIIKGIYAPASPALGCRLKQNPPRVTVLHFEIFEYHWGIWIYSNYLTLKNCRILEEQHVCM